MEDKKLTKKQKAIISFATTALVIGIVIGMNQYHLNEVQEQANITNEEKAVEHLTNTTITSEGKTEAKAAMTQDEMEEEIAKHKSVTEVTTHEEVLTEGEAINVDTVVAEDQDAAISTIDFEGLWDINPDIYAWISIPGTEIEYPILQHATDNSYYLNYNIDGSYGYPGCIYTENMNNKDFQDPNTLIYGHNMKNGTMFTGLHKFKDKEFFENNNTIVITTPEKTLSYQIFASYTYDNRHIYHSFDFGNESVYESYLQSIFDIRDMSANINKEIEVTKEDSIITLVTCIGGKPNSRLLLQAVLLD